MTPRRKLSVLRKYNLSASVLDEPNEVERIILENLDKTVTDIFREATFSLNSDFQIHMTSWFYGENGWHAYKVKVNERITNNIKVPWWKNQTGQTQFSIQNCHF